MNRLNNTNRKFQLRNKFSIIVAAILIICFSNVIAVGAEQAADAASMQIADVCSVQIADASSVQTADASSVQTADADSMQIVDAVSVQTADAVQITTSEPSDPSAFSSVNSDQTYMSASTKSEIIDKLLSKISDIIHSSDSDADHSQISVGNSEISDSTSSSQLSSDSTGEDILESSDTADSADQSQLSSISNGEDISEFSNISDSGKSSQLSSGSIGESISESEDDTSTELPARINIVLFGLSGDNGGVDEGRSDSIIICTIDTVNKELKFTSILRDCMVEIEGHDPQKINAAYKYGGAELALKTINSNFGLELKDYVTVNFDEFADIIDELGGVDIELTQEEVDYLNNDSSIPAEERNLSAGLQHLNGIQALEYSRIRKIDSDVVRADRQRTVLGNLLQKLLETDSSSRMIAAAQILSNVEESSLGFTDIITLLLIDFSEYTLQENVIPDSDIDKDVQGGIGYNGEWLWTFDMDEASARLQSIVYGN